VAVPRMVAWLCRSVSGDVRSVWSVPSLSEVDRGASVAELSQTASSESATASAGLAETGPATTEGTAQEGEKHGTPTSSAAAAVAVQQHAVISAHDVGAAQQLLYSHAPCSLLSQHSVTACKH